METRNPNRSPAPEGSRGTRSSPESFSAAEWLFAGIIDRALHHWEHVPALDGGPGDHDLDDFETDTAYLTTTMTLSPASYTYESVWPSSLYVARFAPVRVEVLLADGSPTQ